MISEQIIEQVLDATDLVELIGQHVDLKKKGVRYMGLCPFHSEKTPSFQVNTALNFWYCQGCKQGGNAISFLMKYDNVDFREAVKLLAQQNNISLPNEEPQSDAEHQRQLKREALYILNEEVAKYYRLHMLEHKARVYIVVP